MYLINSFIADGAVLLMFCFIMSIRVKLYRIILASLIASIVNCMLLIVNNYIICQAINVFVTITMLLIIMGKRLCKFECFIKSLVLFYFTGFLLGGVLTCISGTDCALSEMILAAVSLMAVVYIVSGERGISRYRHYNSEIYEVILYRNNNTFKGTGYYDSGNGVREPISGALVIVGNIKSMNSFLTEGEKKYISIFPKLPPNWDGETYIRGIPYNSLGNCKGLLPGIKIDSLVICNKHKNKTYNNVYVGVSLEELSIDERYDFILHREMN